VLYIFVWVFPRRQIVVGRRFGTCISSIFKGWVYTLYTQPLKMELIQVPKRRPTTIWRRGNTQKKIYNIQITVKVWNQE